jgi:hypothetical protein
MPPLNEQGVKSHREPSTQRVIGGHPPQRACGIAWLNCAFYWNSPLWRNFWVDGPRRLFGWMAPDDSFGRCWRDPG